MQMSLLSVYHIFIFHFFKFMVGHDVSCKYQDNWVECDCKLAI